MSLDGVELLPKASVKYLGVELDSNLEWKKHVMNLRAKCLLALWRLSRISRDLPQETRKRLYCALVQPHVDYCCVVWDHCSKHLQLRLKLFKIGAWDTSSILLGALSTIGTELREEAKLDDIAPKEKSVDPIHASKRGPPPTFMENLSSSVTWATQEPEEPPNFIYIGQERTFIRTLLNTQALSYGTPCLI